MCGDEAAEEEGSTPTGFVILEINEHLSLLQWRVYNRSNIRLGQKGRPHTGQVLPGPQKPPEKIPILFYSILSLATLLGTLGSKTIYTHKFLET